MTLSYCGAYKSKGQLSVKDANKRIMIMENTANHVEL